MSSPTRVYSPVPTSDDTNPSKAENTRQVPSTNRFGHIRRVCAPLSLFIDTIIRFYARLTTRKACFWLPFGLIVAITVSMLLVAFLAYPPVTIDMSLDAFDIPNHVVSLNYDALQSANKWTPSRARRSARCFRGVQGCPRWKFDLVYLPQGGPESDNIFTTERLNDIHAVERGLEKLPNFDKFCWENKGECVGINSLLTYFYPSVHDGKYKFDGRGRYLIDTNINDMLRFAGTQSSVYWYVGSGFNVKDGVLKSGILRSQVLFGSPLPGSDGSLTDSERVRVYSVNLTKYLEQASTENVRVLYGGGTIYDYQVEHAIWSDIHLAIVSFALIIILVFILSSFSIYLSFFGLFVVIISFPITYFFNRVVFQIPSVGILNVISLFVIIGIGVDDVFVFINTFRQTAGKFTDTADEAYHRMHYTLKTAGKTTLFTSVTTATAFFANIPSALPAIHDFGLFMGILVLTCYVVTVTVLPPVLFLWSWKIEGLEKACSCSKKDDPTAYTVAWTQEGNSITLSSTQDEDMEMNDVAQDLSSSDSSDSQSVEFCETSDYHLLTEQMQSSAKCQNMTIDEIALSATADTEMESSRFFSLLSRFVSQRLSKWLVVSRLPILILYVVVLIVSFVMVSQLQAAKKPPQLFSSNSDIQQMIDIGYNLTNSDETRCDMCAGYFLDSDQLPIGPPVSPTLVITSKPHQNPDPSHPGHPKPTAKLTPNKGTPKVSTKSPPLVGPTHETAPTHHQPNKPTEGEKKTESVVTPPAATPKRIATPPNGGGGGGGGGKGGKTPAPKPKTPGGGGGSVVAVTSSPEVPHQITLCASEGSCSAANRPAPGNSAVVYVVLGIRGINQTVNYDPNHVISGSEDEGNVLFDPNFVGKIVYGSQVLSASDTGLLIALCDICVSAQDPERGLILPDGADCIPGLFPNLADACQKLMTPDYKYNFIVTAPRTAGSSRKLQAQGKSTNENSVQFIAMAFQTTTNMGDSSFGNLAKYRQWEKFIDDMKSKHEGIHIESVYQTSEYWVTVFRETVAVSSAIYSIVLSSILCLCWVIIFTGHFWLLVVVFLSIAGTILTVLTFIYFFGWTFGGVEAITLSVLVGTAVDYIVHLVESFVLAGEEIKERHPHPNVDSQNRVRWGISRIGVSILSSAATTIAAAIPLCFTQIQLFAKFGQILLLNTAMSVTYAMTVTAAMLATFGGLSCCCLRRYKSSCFSCMVSFLCVAVFLTMVVVTLYVLHLNGHEFPGPDGNPLF